MHYSFYFLQAIAKQRTSRAYNITNSIRQPYAWSNFYRSANFVNTSSNIVLGKKCFNDIGVGGRNIFSVKKLDSSIIISPGNCNRQSAFCKIKSLYDLILFLFFGYNIFAYYANICDFIFDVLWNIIVSEEKNFYREISGLCLQLVPTIAER